MTGGDSSTTVSAIGFHNGGAGIGQELGFYFPFAGWTKGSGTSNNGIDTQGDTYSNAPSVWWSETFRLGGHFAIRRLRIPLSQAIAANMAIVPTIYVDNATSGTALNTINNTNYSKGEKYVSIDVSGVEGYNSFFLGLKWPGSALLTVELPILIEYEFLPE